jgi:hypothetical protein
MKESEDWGSIGGEAGHRTTDIQWQVKMDIPAQKEIVNTLFLHCFFLSKQPTDWLSLFTLIKMVHLYSIYWSNVNLFSKHPQTHPEIIFYYLSGHSITKLSQHIKLTITDSLQ